ncbi:hypothetical protein [Actinopolyspora halophila]|uniref:hypothetical protein n=1 Tax=Actinopolyspora halophila TaxID=1850 RepID=UPI0003828909|nr:hypothetical protein [Actinopolyspora halophila]
MTNRNSDHTECAPWLAGQLANYGIEAFATENRAEVPTEREVYLVPTEQQIDHWAANNVA